MVSRLSLVYVVIVFREFNRHKILIWIIFNVRYVVNRHTVFHNISIVMDMTIHESNNI